MQLCKISKLTSKNFRNLQESVLTFSPGINCIFGGNGNGKTNLLEAVYFLAKKKSFRKNALFPQMISIDSDQLEIQLQAFLEHDAGEGTLSTKWDQYGQLWALDGRASRIQCRRYLGRSRKNHP